MSERAKGALILSCLYCLKGQLCPIASSQQVVSPNRKPHLMAAYATVVGADVCIGLIRYSLGRATFISSSHRHPRPLDCSGWLGLEPHLRQTMHWLANSIKVVWFKLYFLVVCCLLAAARALHLVMDGPAGYAATKSRGCEGAELLSKSCGMLKGMGASLVL
jgi:hypothetical protein